MIINVSRNQLSHESLSIELATQIRRVDTKLKKASW